ncbi:MAG: hypothetical protein LBC81_00950 [Tannerellaceae bacterium]|nr:hypothetical protein [Tannerellaceae bacterium]
MEPSPDISPADTDYEPTAEDWADYGAYLAERESRGMEERLPQPEDYGIIEPVPELLFRRLWSRSKTHRPLRQVILAVRCSIWTTRLFYQSRLWRLLCK